MVRWEFMLQVLCSMLVRVFDCCCGWHVPFCLTGETIGMALTHAKFKKRKFFIDSRCHPQSIAVCLRCLLLVLIHE